MKKAARRGGLLASFLRSESSKRLSENAFSAARRDVVCLLRRPVEDALVSASQVARGFGIGEPVFCRASAVAELFNHVLTGNVVEGEVLHVVALDHEAAQLRIVGILHMPGRRFGNIAFAVVAGVKPEGRVRFDADIADRKKQRAGRLAEPDDAERLAAAVILRNDRIEAAEIAAVFEAAGSTGQRRARRAYCKREGGCSGE